MQNLLFCSTQMISTVTSKLDPQYSAVDALKPLDGKYDGAQNFSDENH
jgi:hypothetical protein